MEGKNGHFISLSYVYYDINYSSHLILIKLLANALDIFEVIESSNN